MPRVCTYHSQQPPSHHISNDPMAVKARSIVALPSIRTPCTIPPLPPRPPSSPAMFMKLSFFRYMFPSGTSRLSLPHSQDRIHPFGASVGRTGMGLWISGSLCVSLSQEPRPLHALKSMLRNGALIIPMVGLPLMRNAMDTQYIGNR